MFALRKEINNPISWRIYKDMDSTEKEVLAKIYLKKYLKFCTRDMVKRKTQTPENIETCVSRLMETTAKLNFDIDE